MYPTKGCIAVRNALLSCFALLLLIISGHSAFGQINYLQLPPASPKIIKGQSDLVIENLAFSNLAGDNIKIYSSKNIIIRNCYFGASLGEAISIEGSSNITIENCFFANNRTGVYAVLSSGIKVNNNEFINVHGPFPRGQYVQFNNVSGEGNSVTGNRGECFVGESYPEDLINMFGSSGTSGSPINILNNQCRGGGPSLSGGGILGGDYGGSWVRIENNLLIDPGNYGVAVAGGNNITLNKNKVFSKWHSYNNAGLIVWAQGGASCSNITVTRNEINFPYKLGGQNNLFNGGGCGNVDYSTNIWNQSLESMNFPDRLITFISEDELWRVREQSQQFRVGITVGSKPPWLARPTANAGIDKNITGNTTSLKGDGGSSYNWVQVSGPNSATFDNPASSTVNLSNLISGVYTFRLEVKNSEGAADADWVSVTVTAESSSINQPPVADAGNDIGVTLPVNTVSLNGNQSSDADGSIVSYQWMQVSGPDTAIISDANQSSTEVSGLAEGNYIFRLTVTDDKGSTASSTISVVVNPETNELPVAQAGSDIDITLPGNTVILNGSQSKDADGTIVSYQWSQVSGPNTAVISGSDQPLAEVSGLVEGDYIFRLIVVDDKEASASATVSIVVNVAANEPPIADAGNDIEINLPVSTISLNGDQSKDVDGGIVSYQWAQVAGPDTAMILANNQSATEVSGLIEGDYIFRLTVKDDKGAMASSTITVVVNAETNEPPVAQAGSDIQVILPVNVANLNGSQSKDADGTIVSYQWSQVSGPDTAVISANDQSSTEVLGLVEGDYIFRLTVTDDKGTTASSTVSVVVNAATNQPPVANAGNGVSVTLPVDKAILTGNMSYDPDGVITAYKWSQASGPDTAVISGNDQSSAEVSGLVEGDYIFRLTVKDDKGAAASSTVNVRVNAATNQPPLAEAGADMSITLPVNTVSLNGDQSKDADGTISSYQWSQVSGPNTAAISSNNQSATEVSGLVEGDYIFRLTVTDDKGAASSSTVSVSVNAAANQPPVANAGNAVSITLPVNMVTLNGNRSTDPDGIITAYKWSQVSGPNTAAISTRNQSSTEVLGLIEGDYIFRLTIKDDKGASASATVNVRVNAATNQSPVAEAGADIGITLPVNMVSLNGSQSKDADGTIVSYQWSQVSGPDTAAISAKNQPSTEVSGLVEGDYIFRLTVTDDKGATATSTVSIVVNAAANLPPVANAGNEVNITLPVNKATLNGNRSTDSDGVITAYKWSQVSGPNKAVISASNESSTEVSGLLEGDYVFRLTVKDDKGASASSTVSVRVNAAVNQPPVAEAGNDVRITLPVNSVTLNGSQSKDADGTIVSYHWLQVSGPGAAVISTNNQSSTQVSGLAEGDYIFRLTVKDDKGASASSTVSVRVNAAVNQPPVANAGNGISITLPVNKATLNGSSSTDPDGVITTYRWSQVSGPNTAAISANSQSSTQVSDLTTGDYIFRLTVTDNKGAAASSTVSVVVNAATNRPPIANAGNAMSITLPVNKATLNGTKSTDPDGIIVAYNWSQVSGPDIAGVTSSNQAITDVFNLKRGVYSFRLVVKDDKGAMASAIVNVTVNQPANKPPKANAGSSQVIMLSSNETVLDGSRSEDPDGKIRNYQWRQISGSGLTTIVSNDSIVTQVSGFTEGDYVFELTVKDDRGAISKDTVMIAVVNNFRSFTGGLMLYPNPTIDKLNINLYNDNFRKAQINVFDLNGKPVLPGNEISNLQNQFKTTINVSHLRPGVYIIEILMDNKEKISAKFFKN